MCGANPHLGNKSWTQAIIKNIKKGDSSLLYRVFYYLVLYFCGETKISECKNCSHYSEMASCGVKIGSTPIDALVTKPQVTENKEERGIFLFCV